LKVLIPTAPASLAGSATATLIQLTWSDLSSYEKGYVLERKLSTETTFVAIADLPAGATSFQNTGLAEATLYEYRVVAYNEYGQSAYSNILSIKTNSRPVSEDAELEVEENSTLLIAAEDFEQHYSDADLDPLHHILITLLPANGKLKLNNANVFVNQTINASALDMLTFVPNTDVLGDMIIGYRVHDGKDYSAQTYKLTVKVVPIITGVEDEKLTDLEYFPVPVTNALHLRSTTAKVKEVTLMDLSGRTFMTKSLAMGETTLDLTSCPPGVYMLQVKTGNVLRAYKLIKR
jgi:hypothetical protein